MFAQRDAILSLLRDDDAHTVELVKEQLASHGREAVPGLLDLLSGGDGCVARHVEEILHAIDAREAREELTELCRDFPNQGGLDALEYAAFLLARVLAPGADVENARRQLDRWGEALAKRLPQATTADERVRLVGDFFGCELDFRGGGHDACPVRGSLLPEVLKSRRGMPITLALVYLFTGARAGIDIEGIGFPGRFLVRVEEVLLDPFARGKVLTPADCADLLLRQNLKADPSFFRPAPMRAIFRRMLANLLHPCRIEDAKVADALEEWIEELDGQR